MTDLFTRHFATALDRWMKQERLTDTQAAKHLGMTVLRIQQYLNGSLRPTREEVTAVLEKIAYKS